MRNQIVVSAGGVSLLGILLIGTAATAQTHTVIHSFGILTNVTGWGPGAPLVQAPDGTLYGTAGGGEGTVNGTVFKINSDGTGFKVLKWFTNSAEGAGPAGLTLSGSTLFGTTVSGGSLGGGTVFKVNTDGTGYMVLHNFALYGDGGWPSSVTLSGGTLYGTTQNRGSNSADGTGTVFKLNTDGTGFTVLRNFPFESYDPSTNLQTNSDGAFPFADLTLSGGTLYGTTSEGGSLGGGTVFKVNTDGTGFTVLKSFTGAFGSGPQAGLTLSGSTLYGTTSVGIVFKVNTDGTGYAMLTNIPPCYGDLALSGSTLYGTAGAGGSSGLGTVFKLNTDGTGYTVLYSFVTGHYGVVNHYPGLTLSGSTLYGTTPFGGSGYGTVFRLNTDGTGYTLLYSFAERSDGVAPYAGLTLSGRTLYGTTVAGGSSDNGTVFKVNTDGTGYTMLKNFDGSDGDGAAPYAGLTLSGSALYGTTGGRAVFKVDTDGTDYTVLHNFALEGSSPHAGVTLSGSTLYGTTENGGSSGLGTVFQVNTDGTDYAVLYNFAGGSDGSSPYAGLALSGSTLYGTTEYGGSSHNGTVFQVNTDGTGYNVLYDFAGFPSDGAYPSAGLTLSGSTLFGTTARGGSLDNGTVFQVNTDGTGYNVLYNFAGGLSDGRNPVTGLTLCGSTLYGTTSGGGSLGRGTVFKVNTDGTDYAVLYNFAGGSDGAYPVAGLTLSGTALYGTTSEGGSLDEGTVFSLSFEPQLTIIASGTDVILSWPTNVAGFDYTAFTLQAATNLVSSVWTTNLPPPVVVNGQLTVTNPISGTQQFFRLSQQ